MRLLLTLAKHEAEDGKAVDEPIALNAAAQVTDCVTAHEAVIHNAANVDFDSTTEVTATVDAIGKAIGTITAIGASAQIADGIDWEATTKAADENLGKIIDVMDLLETDKTQLYWKTVFLAFAGRGGLEINNCLQDG